MFVAPSPGPTSAQPPQPAAGRGLQSDYQTFLRMLTVQMQNQDPLNPMAASDFAVQLATFSGVEQATRTNQLLTALLARSGLTDLGGWVGMEARVTGGVWFDGNPMALMPDPILGATRVTLVVRDEAGAIVDTRALDPAATSATWDGRTSAGRTLPPGRYSFEVESRSGEDLLDVNPVTVWQPVQEARIEGGATLLVLPGGLMVDSAQVTGLRRPPPPG